VVGVAEGKAGNVGNHIRNSETKTMNKVFIILTCLTLISCGNRNYEGIYKNQFNHSLTIEDSTFEYVTYDGMQGVYYSYGKVSEKKNSIILTNDSIKNACCYNSVQIKTIILEKKSYRKLKNSDYSFRK